MALRSDKSEEAQLVEYLQRASRIFVFCGAGVSAESGLPTFRGMGGLWEGHRVEDVATPEAFARDPATVWRFYTARQAGLTHAEPNPAHQVLAAMERHYPAFLLVSQNVDDLHERAGSQKLVKLHGSLMETRCTLHGTVALLEEPVPLPPLERGELPRCPEGGLLRPNVVWFGEWLNPDHLAQIEQFLLAAEAEPPGSLLLLSIGTSGQVSGGYGFLELVAALGGRTVEINPEPTPFSNAVDLALRSPAGELLARVWPQVANSKAQGGAVPEGD